MTWGSQKKKKGIKSSWEFSVGVVVRILQCHLCSNLGLIPGLGTLTPHQAPVCHGQNKTKTKKFFRHHDVTTLNFKKYMFWSSHRGAVVNESD